MKSYALIHQLLSLVEELEAQSADKPLSLQDFAGFLVNRINDPVNAGGQTDIRFGEHEKYAQELGFQLDNNIGRYFIYMSRYAKFYIKKALAGTPLQTGEDFTALAILLTHEYLSKTELISHNLQEKTSGTEVIRRLIAAGLVEQWVDEQDKRVKKVAISQKGRELLYAVFEDMGYVGKMITGKLTVEEKLTLQHLLQKLEAFHYPIHEKKSITTFEDLKALSDTLTSG